ncbi:unnamed protein product [Laminaria digitata]
MLSKNSVAYRFMCISWVLFTMFPCNSVRVQHYEQSISRVSHSSRAFQFGRTPYHREGQVVCIYISRAVLLVAYQVPGIYAVVVICFRLVFSSGSPQNRVT